MALLCEYCSVSGINNIIVINNMAAAGPFVSGRVTTYYLEYIGLLQTCTSGLFQGYAHSETTIILILLTVLLCPIEYYIDCVY